jgi:glycyl-tRNA synthetase beta chain
MSDFLLELRCEEIPARMQAKARADLEKLFTAQLKDAGLEASSITTYSTPRRLALIARGLPMQTEAVSEERKGPAANAPEQALAGFLRSTGLNREDLVEREVKGKSVLFAIIEKPGQPTTDILAAAIPAIIAAFPWPKSQRWGEASISSESLRWVRPLSSIIALFDGEVVDCEVHGIASGRETMGHRFHSDGKISINDAASYEATLRAAHVIVDHEERQNIVRQKSGARCRVRAG